MFAPERSLPQRAHAMFRSGRGGSRLWPNSPPHTHRTVPAEPVLSAPEFLRTAREADGRSRRGTPSIPAAAWQDCPPLLCFAARVVPGWRPCGSPSVPRLLCLPLSSAATCSCRLPCTYPLGTVCNTPVASGRPSRRDAQSPPPRLGRRPHRPLAGSGRRGTPRARPSTCRLWFVWRVWPTSGTNPLVGQRPLHPPTFCPLLV